MDVWLKRFIKESMLTIAIVLIAYVALFLYLYSAMRAVEDRESGSSAANGGHADIGCHDAGGGIGSSPGILWSSPYRICPGQRFTVDGFGFKPGAAVTLEVTSKGIVGAGLVDASGVLSATGGPIDESFCSLPDEADLIAIIDGERESVSSKFC